MTLTESLEAETKSDSLEHVGSLAETGDGDEEDVLYSSVRMS